MANTLAALVRVLKPLSVQSKSAFIKSYAFRSLYSKTTLGIDNYLQHKQAIVNQMSNISSSFREKMNEFSTDDSKNMVFTEDLKNMVHLAENDDDIELVMKMLRRFNQQNKQLRFGNYVFGPVIMRMFYCLNKPKEALECFKDPELTNIFTQLISYQLLLDLLFENKMYNEMLEAFQIIKEAQIEGIKFAKNVVVLTQAACYKLNSQESLDFALKLWSELNEIGHQPMRRAITFCAALALNQGKPEIALEILSSTRNSSYTTIRNTKALALLEIGRIEEVLALFKSILREDTAAAGPVQTFNKDVIEKVRTVVEQSTVSPDIKMEFNRVEKYFKEQGHLSDTTLDEQLCQEIAIPPADGKRFNDGFKRQPYFADRQRDDFEFNNRIDRKRTNRVNNRRPGLFDLQ